MNRERIIGKVLLNGTLELCSPLLIGSGSQRAGSDTDTQVLLDKNGHPFIPGTSVAGVLRAAMPPENNTNALFGGKIKLSGFPKGIDVQSAVNIDDVELPDAQRTLRDGVAIDDTRGVAADEKKYDYELVERGAKGKFHAEITLRDYHREALGDVEASIRRLAENIAAGFRCGAMTAKGFGHVQVHGLSVDHYDFQNIDDAVAWLSENRGPAAGHYDVADGKAQMSSSLVVDAYFDLNGSLIVKDTEVPPKKQNGDSPVHAVMKESNRDFLIPGPSVKGALRHHASRILERLGISDPRAILNKLMGLDEIAMKEAQKNEDDKTLRRSRFLVNEVYIAPDEVKAFAQTRNRIDRFTGGTIGGALFTTEAIWGKDGKAPIHIHFEIRGAAEDYEIGLALLLLKDLSLGRIPLGGEKSIGRGVLTGVRAEIRYRRKNNEQLGEEAEALIENGKLVQGKADELQELLKALVNKAEVTA